SAAFRAISRRCSGVSLEARACPPLAAPSFDRATACGFFFRAMPPVYACPTKQSTGFSPLFFPVFLPTNIVHACSVKHKKGSFGKGLGRAGRCEMDVRELKGLEIAARSRIVFKDGAWLIPSQSGKGAYSVVLKPGEDSCTCDDFSLT